MATISFTLNDCLKELADVASSRVKRYENEVSQTRWLDELGRLRIWAGNTGALQCDQLSLDYRLRDASHLKNEISRILQRVLQVVRNLSDLLNEPEDTLGDEALLDPAGEVLNEEDLMTDAQMLHQSLHNAINLLNQLSLETRKPADHDILLNVSSKDVSLFEPWAQQHVSRAFPNLDEGTLHRLSAAMTKQRAVLQYRLQKPRPSRGIDGSEPTLPEREATGSSQAGSLNQLQLPETFTFKLQPPYPTSAFFIDHDSVSIPSPPETSTYSSLFECPYCGSLMTIKDSEEWVCHIFEDLTPYACLSSDCTTPFKLYESRSQWYHHICETHFVSNNNGTFNCPLCKEIFGPPVTFDRHVGEHLEQLALLVFREGPDLTIPDPASQDGSSKVSKGPTLPVSDLRIQEPANDRLAAENTSTGSAAERSLEADQQSVEPFDNPSEIPMALSEDMTHLQTPESPIDNDKNMSLPPDLSSQAAQKTTAELQDEFDPLSPTGSMSSIELVSPVDIDRKSDCSPVPSSKQTFDRQAAFNRFFPELVHSLPQVSTESRAGPREPPEANRASPTHERGRKSTQYLSEYQSPILDDFDVYLKLQSSRRNLASSDDEEKMAISAYSPSPDLSGRRLSPPENNRPTKLMASILPTYHDYTSNDLNEEGDEYIQIKFDDVGETKVDFLGYLRHDREYRCQTFRLPHRGKKLFMLSAQCADALSFRSSRALFMNYRSLHGMVASSVEKETMMEKHILPVEGQQRDVTFVSARSIFLQFGCRIIANGRRFRDDYWESRAREEGFTEANIRDDQQTSVARPRTGLVISKEEDVSKREPICRDCGTHTTPLWRRDEFGYMYCNPCGLFLKLHGRHRPTDLQRSMRSGANSSSSTHAYPTSYYTPMSGSSLVSDTNHMPSFYPMSDPSVISDPSTMSDPSYMSGPSTMSGPYSTPGSYPMPDNFSPPGPYCMPDPQNMSHLYSTSYHLSGPGPGPGPYVMYGPYPSSYHGPSYHIPSPSSLRGPRYTSWPDSHVYDGEIRRDQPEDDPAQRWPLYRGRQERHQKSHDWNPNDLEPRLPGNQILAFDLSATDQKKPQESIESSLRSGRSLDSLYTEPGTNESFDFDTFNKNDAILSPKPRRKKGEIPQDSLAQEKAVTARKMFDPSNLVWTRLDKRRVEEKVLKAGGESFEEHGTYFSILGDLSENKIEEYVRKTTEYRAFHNINTVGRDGTDYR